jgi:methylated-DNA-protein-cysteine methyltransferase-like protein
MSRATRKPRAKRKTLRSLLLPLQGAPERADAGPSPALEAIWDVVARIPRGRAATYGDVARAAGLPGRARQAGYALRHMPDDMHLPWHRVVGAGGKIAFPPSSSAHREQTRRLRGEGVEVRNGRVARATLMTLDETPR